jgi:hypothetical protein
MMEARGWREDGLPDRCARRQTVSVLHSHSNKTKHGQLAGHHQMANATLDRGKKLRASRHEARDVRGSQAIWNAY